MLCIFLSEHYEMASSFVEASLEEIGPLVGHGMVNPAAAAN